MTGFYWQKTREKREKSTDISKIDYLSLTMIYLPTDQRCYLTLSPTYDELSPEAWANAKTYPVRHLMNTDEDREELRRKLEGLNDLGALIQRVQAHAKYISTIPINERSDLQKTWILAYEATELKMAPGTEETLFEAAMNLRTLDNKCQQTINQDPPARNKGPRFSFLGRRRGSK